MRVLILMTGAPGSGKSTLIRRLGLKSYTICPDDIRLLFEGPKYDIDGRYGISQKNDKKVWKTVYGLLEQRMAKGEFIVVDATHTSRESFNHYKKLVTQYRYRVYILSTRDVPKEVALKRNELRLTSIVPEEKIKYVPPAVIEKAYARFNSAVGKLPTWAKLITLEELPDALSWYAEDFNNYRRVIVIGDIHGCLDPLVEAIGTPDTIKEDKSTAFVFVGDYIDRGPQNAETMKYIMDIYKESNVYMLEGNHEIWPWYYATNRIDQIRSREFLSHTMPEFEKAGIDKKELRNFYRHLHQMLKFNFYGRTFIVTHGGIPTPHVRVDTISTHELIHGVGAYKDSDVVDETFTKKVNGQKVYSIHGHRNVTGAPIQVTDRAFNLEGRVEAGGYLRLLYITPRSIDPIMVQNNNYRKDIALSNRSPIVTLKTNDLEDVIKQLDKHRGIIKKQVNSRIKSYNFSRRTFRKNNWDYWTKLARSLFIDVVNHKIVARAYPKFFRINELPETRISTVLENFKWPVHVFKKYNGYLGLIGWDAADEQPIYATKSVIDGPMVERFKELVGNEEQRLKQAQEIVSQGKTIAFEVADPERDPHIIEYEKPFVRVLDVIDNTIAFKTMDYQKLKTTMHLFHPIKELIATFDNGQDFLKWFNHIMEDELIEEEGFVIVDQMGFMVKVKTPYYSFWKYMRGMKERILKSEKGIQAVPRVIGSHSKLQVEVMDFMRQMNPDELHKLNIIEIRKRFIKEARNGQKPCIQEYKTV